MFQEIRLHGHLNDSIEYYATAVARDAFQRCFYEADADSLRLFSPGNELLLTSDTLQHRGNGGTFCEYMFGVDMPLRDLAKAEVRNRLVLFGACYNNDHSLEFSNRTDGSQTYERIFFEGNAVCNYFFFLTGSLSGQLKNQQEELLRLLGKQLKRSRAVDADNESSLSEEIFSMLGHRSSLYLVRLVNKKHQQYHERFSRLYHAYKSIPDKELEQLQEMADRLGIDRYQQERMRIDIMYKHPDNRRVVDEYKNILIDCHSSGKISKEENARLTRLKTLSVRNKIPAALFYTLDEMLKTDKLVEKGEQDYLALTRQILSGIFLHEQQIDASINRDDLIKLLYAKLEASENRDHTFEQLLLDTGRVCDEKIRDGADIQLLENFSYIITYFDRFDNASAQINHLAFMENIRMTEENVRSLLGARKEFDSQEKGLFNDLFFDRLLSNPYLGHFGRKKVSLLRKGLEDIGTDRQTIDGVVETINRTTEEENLHRQLMGHVKERIRHFYSRFSTKAEQEELRREITEEMHNKDLLKGDIPTSLFRDVIVNIKKEAMYLHNLMPRIVANHDKALREDFLKNSGLDRFYLEELEREYFQLNNLPLEDLHKIRKMDITAD